MVLFTALRSVLFTVIFYSGSLVYVLTGLVTGRFRPSTVQWVGTQWSRFHSLCTRWLLGQKTRVVGELPRGAYLYVLKHESMFETLDILRMFDRPAIVAKRELFEIPLWGRLARDFGLIPVERTAGASAMRSMLAAAKRAQAAGRPICLFPEGTRVPHGESPPLRAGFAGLYSLLRLPVVPIAIDSGRVSPRGSFLKSAGMITYKVGEVIPAGLDRKVAEARVHAAINALNPP